MSTTTDAFTAELLRTNEQLRNVVGELRAALTACQAETKALRAMVHPSGRPISKVGGS